MAKTLARLLSMAVDISKPKLSLRDPRSDPINATKRLISYTIEKRQNHQQMPNSQQDSVSKSEASVPDNETKHDPNEHDENGEEGVGEGEGQGYEFVNKDTGEVGGPRGPEPTRYGDWEKGGRCCDF